MSDVTKGTMTPTQSEGPKRGRRTPSRRSRGAVVVFLNFFFSLLVIAVLGGAAAFYWGKFQFERRGPLTQEATFMVSRGGGLSSIADGLEAAGIVSNALIFQAGVRMSGAAGQLKAGEYAFAPGTSMQGVMEKLESGRSIMHSVTIPEGWTVAQIYARLEGDETLVGNLPPMPAEGTLLPETYTFTRGTSRGEIVSQMAAAQARLVDEIWAGRTEGLPVETKDEFVTLASIVERETGVDAERPHVASVFVNRLRQGMRLQSDPTFIYGIWGGAGKPSGEPLRRSHIQSNTPYNTYVINGLPPGPIANPGRAALEAVAHPLDTDDLYFVADGTGGHAFAPSLAEHNRNVARYREVMRQQGAADAAAAEDADLVE
ncbi:endolytic transglycosylase MltG [Aureimonas frigidaquae]|uniref:Endolytic murein transglycosylase n=1 Tax=Aureimonas frigidaquae TaxID=424757 RepID=A0A0P0Z2Z6_9HYPH|nr:endolytic transglycosylase MltG [Aureimonas frigidaquae]BAT28310.1 possible deoxychorismate lyase [Aureimonas frigidaquae]